MADENLTPDGGAGDDVRQDDAGTPEIVDTREHSGSDAGEPAESADALASELGWCPKEEWRGDPEDWKPAKDFLKDTVRINKEERRARKNLEDKLARIARTTETIVQKTREDEAAKWQAKFQDAVDAGDSEAALKASKQLAKIELEPAGPEPVVEDFAKRNASWFKVDPIATEMAVRICDQYAHLSADEQLEKAEAVIKKRFPEYFDAPKPRTKGPAEVAEQQGRTARTATDRGPKGFAHLPADAKAIALKFEKQGVSREDFAKEYWKENA
jgi:hypothetical protein